MIRMAVKRLAAEGLAEISIRDGSYQRRRMIRKPRWWDEERRGKWDGDPSRWGESARPITVELGQVLCVRPPLTDAERAAEQAAAEQEERRHREVLAAFRAGSW